MGFGTEANVQGHGTIITCQFSIVLIDLPVCLPKWILVTTAWLFLSQKKTSWVCMRQSDVLVWLLTEFTKNLSSIELCSF